MNKVFNINLGGYPFTIDDDAYQQLSSYLKTVHNHFKRSEGYEEITSDIETRMAELFQESLGNHSIVTLEIVQEAIVIMGTPEEFGAEPMDDFTESTSTSHQSKRKKRSTNYKTGKRLFRDPDDQVIGGVCSGIAAYFGIADPLWVRIFFVAFTISGGVGIPAYIILWAILKEAQTSSDRLSMRGDDINVSNIAKVIEDEVEHITDKISEMTEGWEATGKKKNFAETANFKQGLKSFIRLFGKGIKTGIKLLSTVIKPIIFIVGFVLIIAFAAVWLAAIISFFLGFPFLNFLHPQNPLLGGVFIVNLALFIGIPILSMILLASRLIFRTSYSVKWKGGLIAFYILNAASLFGIASYTASRFSVGAETHLSSERFPVPNDVLTINFTKNPYTDSWLQLGPDGMIKLADDQLVNENIHLKIEKSEDADFVLINETKSRGRGLREAKTLAQNVRHQVSQEGNQLNIQPYFLLNKGEKWRGQSVHITLKVPEGKSIKFNNINRVNNYSIDYVDERHRHHHLFWARDGQTYKMDKDGLLGKGIHRKSEKSKYDFGGKYKDFSRLHIDGNMKIFIEQGEKFSTKLTGRDHYLEKVEVEQYNDVLKVSSHISRTSSPIRLYITMPSLTELDIEQTDDVKLTGFEESAMTIRSESRGDIKAYVNVENLKIKMDGRNELDIRGKGKNLSAYLVNNAKLDAERFSVRIADVKAKNRSSLKLAVSDTLRQELAKHTKIKVDGEPIVFKRNQE